MLLLLMLTLLLWGVLVLLLVLLSLLLLVLVVVLLMLFIQVSGSCIRFHCYKIIISSMHLMISIISILDFSFRVYGISNRVDMIASVTVTMDCGRYRTKSL